MRAALGAMSDLFDRFGNSAASLFSFGFLLSAMRLFMRRFFARLGNVGSTFGKILTMVLLLVDDFLVVRYVSWIGHSQL